MLTTFVASILLSGLGGHSHQEFRRPVRPSVDAPWTVMRQYMADVRTYERARKKSGQLSESEREWVEDQFEFFGMRSHLRMMRGGEDGLIDQSDYRAAIKHRNEMPPMPTDYIITEWTFIGPRGLDGSTSCQDGPVTGRVNAVAYNPQDANDWWVAGGTGGVFKTANNGTSFTGESDTWDTTYASAIAIDPTNANRVYVATGDYPGWWGYGLGLMRTTNGTSWTNELTNEIYGCEVSDILIDPDDVSTILATVGRGTKDTRGCGIWRSTDYGDTWTRVFASTIDSGYAKLSAGIRTSNKRYLYASAGDGGVVRRSENGGATWVDASPSGGGLCAVAASKTHRDVVYCYLSTGNVLKSTDAGDNWVSIRGNLGNITGSGTDFRQVEYNYLFGVINTSPNGVGDDILVFGAVDCFALVDPIGGNTSWSWINGAPNTLRLVHADYHGFSQHPSSKNSALIANDGGVWQLIYITGVFGWVNKNAALRLTEHVFAAPHPDASNFPNYVTTGMWHIGCGFSPNNVNDWRSVHGGDGMWTAIDDTNPQIQFTSDQRGDDTNTLDLRGTSNAWASSQTFSTSTALANEDFAFASPWAEIPGESGALYLAGERLYKFKWTGGTSTWTKAIGGADFSANTGEYVTGIVAVSGGGCFVGTNFGRVQGSMTPSTGMPLIEDFAGCVSSINSNPSDADDLLVSIGGVDRGPNSSGAVWEVLDATGANPTVIDRSGTGNNSLPGIGVNWIERDPYDPTFTWYAATDLGVFYTRDRGSNWYNISESFGLPNALVYHLETSDNILYASTFGRGVWRMSLFSAAPTLTAFTFQAADVTGGNKAPATMTLSREAPPGGLTIAVTSNNLSAVPNQSVHFPGGATTATVQVDTNIVTGNSNVNVTANYGDPVSDSILVRECVVNDLLLVDVVGGDAFLFAVQIDRAAPTGGLIVNLADNDPGTTVNSPVVIPEGNTIGFFTGTTNLVPFNTVVGIQASGPGSGWQENFTKLGVRILSAAVSPDPVWNTEGSGIVVTLNRNAPTSGFPLSIVSGVPAVAEAPSAWSIPSGFSSRTVPITTFYVATDTTAGFRVTDPYQGFIEDTLLVKHIGFSSLTFNPDPVTGGQNSTGTLTLDRTPNVTLAMHLESADPDKVTVPRTVFVQANTNQVTFNASTVAVPTVTDVDIVALLGANAQLGTTRTESLRLLPSQNVVVPSSFTVSLGQVASGNVASLATDDGNVLRVCKFLVPNQTVAPVTVQVDGASALTSASALRLEFRSRMAASGLFGLTLDLWNWSTNNWDTSQVLNTNVNTTFSTAVLNASGNLAQYLRGSDGALRARYRVRQTGPAANPQWCHETDRANWIVTP